MFSNFVSYSVSKVVHFFIHPLVETEILSIRRRKLSHVTACYARKDFQILNVRDPTQQDF